MLENLGTPTVTEISTKLYGSLYDVIPGYKYTSLQAAKYFLEVCGTFKSEEVEAFEESKEMTSAELKIYLLARMKHVFGSKEIKVDLVPELASKASVSSSRVKLRESAMFKGYEARQLLHHEVFTHALTSINGSSQPYMPCIQFNAPRITATQEGLAQFSELITGSIHLLRLKRIACAYLRWIWPVMAPILLIFSSSSKNRVILTKKAIFQPCVYSGAAGRKAGLSS
jgi:hypothetical protein